MVEGVERRSRATVTVDLGAIAANCRRLIEAAAPAELWAVVKADGYGHGAADVASAAVAAGARRLCVATLEEAAALRGHTGGVPVLVMGPLVEGEEADVEGVEVAVSSVAAYDRLRACAPDGTTVHLKLDSGMGRWGLDVQATLELGSRLAEGDGPLRLGGLMSHLASAESDRAFTAEQLRRFGTVADRFPPCPRHIANSAAALGIAEARFDAVRCGIAITGSNGRAPSLRRGARQSASDADIR